MSSRNVTFKDNSAECPVIRIIALASWPHDKAWRFDLEWTAHYIETARKLKDEYFADGVLVLAEEVERLIHCYNSEVRTPAQYHILKAWEEAGDEWSTWKG